MRNKKVILDTNLWISFLISNKLQELDFLLEKGKIRLVFSNELLEEFLTVVRRPKFEKYFSQENLNELFRLFDKYGELTEVAIQITECRDIKDNFLLSLAVESNANFLISGDSDLLILKKIKKTKILNWADFVLVIR